MLIAGPLVVLAPGEVAEGDATAVGEMELDDGVRARGGLVEVGRGDVPSGPAEAVLAVKVGGVGDGVLGEVGNKDLAVSVLADVEGRDAIGRAGGGAEEVVDLVLIELVIADGPNGVSDGEGATDDAGNEAGLVAVFALHGVGLAGAADAKGKEDDGGAIVRFCDDIEDRAVDVVLAGFGAVDAGEGEEVRGRLGGGPGARCDEADGALIGYLDDVGPLLRLSGSNTADDLDLSS
jgi:hypothetical protein